ncbi:MAG: efflux RND transporter periplasmic adaptor subunit [Ignavibacteriales bacterium]|nr:efflux RND transporter periplasmic adaptor subunit [Ignavibacteriales bacterium]
MPPYVVQLVESLTIYSIDNGAEMRLKKKIWLIIGSVIAIIALVSFLLVKSGNTATTYNYGEVTKGNLDIVITSSGTIEAISTVDVGTQVSGKIAKLFVDFNSEVRKGQLLAVLDTVTLAAQVRDAQASYARAKADYKQKFAIHEVNKKLFAKNFISELDYVKSQTDVESSYASLQSAETAVERSKTNLGYAYIYSPINGKIINRTVEQGQTVAASFSSPTLFSIAEDLSSMRILANVDESDIGQIKEGQKVKFTVQTYTDKTFDGVVTQIRLHSNTLSNVVNYTVGISAENKERLLLPGMTATVDFYINHRENVLLVPNTALRVEPSESMMAEIQKNVEEQMKNFPDSLRNMHPSGPPPPSFVNSMPDKNKMKRIFYLDSTGKLKVSPVMIGLTDGKNTEVIASRELKEGMKIITGFQEEENSASSKKTNTLTSPQGGGMPPPPMM